MSEIAKSGYASEERFRTDIKIKECLETFFNKKIRSIIKSKNGLKHDNIIEFQDDTQINIQNKKFTTLNGRGDSFDRRHINTTFQNQFIRKYLVLLCLSRKTKTTTNMTNEQKMDFIKICKNNLDDIKNYLEKCLIGNNHKNDYWCFLKNNNLYIIKSSKLYNYILDCLNIHIKLKSNGTCLYLTSFLYLQRKGGSKTDKSPNHIQAKLRINKDLLEQCILFKIKF